MLLISHGLKVTTGGVPEINPSVGIYLTEPGLKPIPCAIINFITM